MGYFLAETKANCIQIIDFGYVGAKDIKKILSNVCYFQYKAKKEGIIIRYLQMWF